MKFRILGFTSLFFFLSVVLTQKTIPAMAGFAVVKDTSNFPTAIQNIFWGNNKIPYVASRNISSETNIVYNGDFEEPVINGDVQTWYSDEIFGGWTVEFGSIDQVTGWQAASGTQSIDLSGWCNSGAIYQDLSTTPGQTYPLSVAMAGNVDGGPQIKQMEIWWGANLVDSPIFDITGYSHSNMGWTSHNYSVTAIANVTRIKFVSLTEGCFGPAIDDVSVGGTNKPVVVLVHGWQGLSQTGGYTCSGINRYDGTNSSLGDLADMLLLSNDYDVWIAHLDSSPLGTPALTANGACLKNQIESVYQSTGKKVIIVAHSMGGLVSRVCINNSDCGNKVSALYTLGSPHAGINNISAIKILLKMAEKLSPTPITDDLCVWQAAVCDMSFDKMVLFNRSHLNNKNIRYTFIGGSPDQNSSQLRNILNATDGKNDGLVGRYSAAGWVYVPLFPDLKSFVPWWWDNPSPPTQIWTNEVHNQDWGNAYYEGYLSDGTSQAFHCIQWTQGMESNPGYCQDANTASQTAELPTSPNPSQTTQMLEGHLDSGEAVSETLHIDTSTYSQFNLIWTNNPLTFTLKRPDGVMIDPIYAATHPNEVTYESSPGGNDFPPSASYAFTSTIPGTWQLNIFAGNVGTSGTDYLTFATLESTRTFSFGSDLPYYTFEDTAILTATLDNGGTGIPGAVITATVNRPDGVVDTLIFTDMGNGSYSASYPILDMGGHVLITLNAFGTDNGIPFARQGDMFIIIAPQDAQFTGMYSDQGNDDNGDGLFEQLDFTAEVDVLNAGDYVVSALLLSEDGQLITHIAEDTSLVTGIYTITLPFDGDEIRTAQIDGSYTVANLQITAISSGIPSQIVDEAWTTVAYSWSEFGTCKTLSLSVNPPGSGDITTFPTPYCNQGTQFVTGTAITLTANANPGYEFDYWSGELISTINPISITIDSDLVITGNFTATLATITPTPAPSDTATPTATSTPSPTFSPTPTATPSPTSSATLTQTPSITVSPSSSLTIIPTNSTPTNTGTPSLTPTKTPTPITVDNKVYLPIILR